MTVKNPNPLPRLTREINIQEKRMRTFELLEEEINRLQLQVKEINVNCPFGSDSLEVQHAVNVLQNFCNDYAAFLSNTRNYVLNQHYEAVRVLSDNEDLLDPQEEVEDAVAVLKTQVSDELEASRQVREGDRKKEFAFNSIIRDLEKKYFGTERKPTVELNRGNDHYPIVE